MAKFRSIKNSFLGGQISPTATGRTDLPQYPHSCELLRNMIPRLSGGAYRRPGTLHQDTLTAYGSTGTDRPPRLLPFIVNRQEAYSVLLGVNGGGPTGYAKVYRATGNATGQLNATAVTGATPYQAAVTGSYPTILGNGDDDVWGVQYAQSADTMWLVHPSYKPQVLKRTAVDTFTWSDFDNGLSGSPLMNAYPYLNQNTSAVTLQPGATTGSTNLTASAAFFDPKHVGALFAIYDGAATVGACKVTAYTSSTQVTVTIIVAFGSTAAKATWWESAWSDYRGWPRAVCIFQQRLCYAGNTHQPDSIWFSQTGNYFQMSHIHESAGPATQVIVRGAQIAVTPGVVTFPVDDSQGDGQTTGPTGIQAFRITLSQSQLDQIQWLSPDKELLVGTLEQEWVISAQENIFDIAHSPTVLQSKYGSDYLPASRIGYELIFAMASLDEVRAYQYNYIDASFFAEPIQLLFDQYPKAETSTYKPGRRKFRQTAWDLTRSTLWCVDTMGNFFGMTRDRKLGVTMWHTHQLGGFNAAQGVGTGAGTHTDPAWAICDGSVVSFAVVPNPFSGVNDIWLVVKRTVATKVQWQIERMIGKDTVRDSAFSAIAPGTLSNEPYLVDACAVFTDNGDGTLNYSPGTHLNGYNVEGTYYSLTYGLFAITGAAAVAAGAVNLVPAQLPADYGAATPFHVFTLGLHYDSIIKTVRIEAGSVIGTAQGAIKRINRAVIRFFKTLYCKAGSAPGGEDLSNLEVLRFGTGAVSSASPEIFTGDKVVQLPSTYDRDGYIYLLQDQPMPFSVVCIIAGGEVEDMS